MARIRTIKPEFWTSEQVMECSPNARLAFIGIWNFCDDAGRMPASAKQIKALVFPSDDFTSANVRGMLDELERNGLVRLYVVDGKEFLAVTGWHHQKIDRPQKPKTPEPPDHEPPPARRTFGAGTHKGTHKGKDNNPPAPAEPHPARPTINGTDAEPAKAVEPAPGRAWATRENFDRIERRCREALPDGGPQDPQIGPMARLEADGLDLEAEIIPVLLDVAASCRVPIRTWRLYADRVAERVALQRQTRTAQGLAATPQAPTPADEMVDMSPHGRYPESSIRKWIARYRENPRNWNESVFGPPPGAPSCKVPPRLLIGEAARWVARCRPSSTASASGG